MKRALTALLAGALLVGAQKTGIGRDTAYRLASESDPVGTLMSKAPDFYEPYTTASNIGYALALGGLAGLVINYKNRNRKKQNGNST